MPTCTYSAFAPGAFRSPLGRGFGMGNASLLDLGRDSRNGGHDFETKLADRTVGAGFDGSSGLDHVVFAREHHDWTNDPIGPNQITVTEITTSNADTHYQERVTRDQNSDGDLFVFVPDSGGRAVEDDDRIHLGDGADLGDVNTLAQATDGLSTIGNAIHRGTVASPQFPFGQR